MITISTGLQRAALLVFVMLVACVLSGQAQDSNRSTISDSSEQAVKAVTSGERIDWQVMSSGGLVTGASDDFIHMGTIGQAATGSGSGGIFSVGHGFWLGYEGSDACCDVPGDANNDGTANVGDAVYLISYVFKGGPPPFCLAEGDANDDCDLNVADAVFLALYSLSKGTAPSCNCSR